MSRFVQLLCQVSVLAACLLPTLQLRATAPETLPLWANASNQDKVLTLQIPRDLQATPKPPAGLQVLVLELDPEWAPDWKQAAFQLKAQIVALKAAGPDVLVGVRADESKIHALLAFELAPYIDGYLYQETPFLPAEDPTGKLWLDSTASEHKVLKELLEASSLGVELVLFRDTQMDRDHESFLQAIRLSRTGGLDQQPAVSGLPAEQVSFFFDPATGYYQLALYGDPEKESRLSFVLEEGLKVKALFPERAKFRQRLFGARTELILEPGKHYFFQLEPAKAERVDERLEIVEKAEIDPYELVVKNQVFKKAEAEKFQSLRVNEIQDLRYQPPTGGAVTVSYHDRLYSRKDQPNERVRLEMYIQGVKWPYKELPELPLIQPERVQREPLVIDLDRSYNYSYEGEDSVAGRAAWKVGFRPQNAGKYYSGMVWIDRENGAHLKIRANQRELEPPVIANELNVYYGWVEDGGVRYWTQIREENLQVINIAGLTLPLQIDTRRQDFAFNLPELDKELAAIYQTDAMILRDTAKGFRYLKKSGDERKLSEDMVNRSRALLGGVLYDPAMDTPLPLLGYNYTSFDFRKTGLQANFFIAGAVNDLILSNPNFLDRGWDLTGELFLTPIYFPDTLYENKEKVEELEVESLRESLFVTLGIPLGAYFKTSLAYSLAYNKYQEADETAPEFVIPSKHLEHIGRINLQFNRRRISSELQYEFVNRSKWEEWGMPENAEPLYDRFRKLSFDFSLSKPLPKMQTLRADMRFLKGWDLDRFSRFGFGFFENSVSGFGTSGVEATRALRLRMGYEIGMSGLAQLTLRVDGARAWNDRVLADGSELDGEPVDLYGVGLGINFIGPWKLVMRAQLGYGLHSDLAEEAHQLNGQIVFLRLF